MKDLLKGYKRSLQQVRKAKKEIENKVRKSSDDLNDLSLLNSMERDLRWTIEWLEMGHQPPNRRGVERLAGYQREYPIDPRDIDFYSYESVFDHQGDVSIEDWEMFRIENALSVLSPLEREVYVMSKGYLLSYLEIAVMLNVAKGTVQKMMERAENKIKNQKETSLFFVG
ncbi:sigma factor-like helix-turn-helix DNA-binding protein [Thermoflavimicrobium dichotomicum]|uniref:RNA polymerase sigma-70 factor, ECF subfamily n=1 Tax=Thermoflavimicrobium dichotomicum TaxID=46223 RepID=A0A1I3UIM2_9BACL|nr:sigma factor-like helix-turn-helix DNA-binding protein [Thermoflavimicrobium dichotomicum]SFJ82890.1 RNA polymerase sigma-70 factor, ECF subfamily [Thermoflavimicrobium dichotomicum]